MNDSRAGLVLGLVLALGSAACSETDSGQAAAESTVGTEPAAASEDDLVENPFLRPSPLYFNYPPFDAIKDEHYRPAFLAGMDEELAEIEAIANNSKPATFENTIVAMERAGRTLDRVATVFDAMAAAHTNETIQAIDSEMAPRRAAHRDAIRLNEKLFARIRSVHERLAGLDLDPESRRLVEDYYRDFVLAGALLSAGDKERLKEMNAELASLKATFEENLLKETNDKAIVVDSRQALDGLSENDIASAAQAAKTRGFENSYLLPLLSPTQQPALSSLRDRALRQRIMETSLGRGCSGGPYDNRSNFARIAKLRAEKARLLGYEHHAAFVLEQRVAPSTEAVNERLAILAEAAVSNAHKEAAELQAMIDAEGHDFQLKSWDWAFYTERLRAKKFDFDAARLKPYLEVNNVLVNGVFFAAEQVYGLSFKERSDLPVYHEDVRVWEVFDADGSSLALFIEDFYARPSKRGGAWYLDYVPQSKLMNRRTVGANHLNVPKPPVGEPTLLTWDEVTTMFHEFGHALHGMFSDVRYPKFSGTSVPRDFVEYPSQVNEMWALWPEVLANYAVHHETGEAMPPELLEKLRASSKFNEGFKTTEYLEAALIDQAWHQHGAHSLPGAEGVLAFEAQALKSAGVAFEPVPPRYRTTYFRHMTGGYSAGYYSYIWSEVLDADTVEWFKENGGMLRENGDYFRRTLLSRGFAEDPMQQFRNFRGRDPEIRPLLERHGLTSD